MVGVDDCGVWCERYYAGNILIDACAMLAQRKDGIQHAHTHTKKEENIVSKIMKKANRWE
jgi:hypothetical protein